MRSGSGLGFGSGFGFGFGSGSGLGFGSGFGFGFGSGFVSGDGFGFGDGKIIGKIKNYEVRHLRPWPYLKIGCEIHSIAEWESQWREIAARNGIKESAIDLDAIRSAILS